MGDMTVKSSWIGERADDVFDSLSK